MSHAVVVRGLSLTVPEDPLRLPSVAGEKIVNLRRGVIAGFDGQKSGIMKERLWRVRDQSGGRELVLLDFYHDVYPEFDDFIGERVVFCSVRGQGKS